ncbi:MAG: tyrosine-type recombinase/integrase [Actinobacteria bacterium]|nr:tyrosine-type recombinase/integrase [Actinomycetota bacterium]
MKVEKLIYEYDWYLKQTAGVSENTKRQYLRYVNHFLSEGLNNNNTDKLSRLKPEDLIHYVIEQKKHHSIPVLKCLVKTLRSFLKFLQMRGLCDPKLADAVPSIATWKLSSIPDRLTKEQLEEFLASFNKKSAVGRRNYAIALCLARLGLRSSEVAQLTLDDIDWRSGNICITSSKSRRLFSLPLPGDVGKAITEYLLSGRPSTENRHIFVCHLLHKGKPLSSSAVGIIIRRQFKRVGMSEPPKGAHILRHTVATHMVNNGISIKEIADFLGHRSLDSTVIYAKVNLTMLAEAALPWPEGDGKI